MRIIVQTTLTTHYEWQKGILSHAPLIFKINSWSHIPSSKPGIFAHVATFVQVLLEGLHQQPFHLMARKFSLYLVLDAALSQLTLFLDSTSITVPLPQWVVHRASGGFTHISSPTVIFACPCSTLSVMACGCCHFYMKRLMWHQHFILASFQHHVIPEDCFLGWDLAFCGHSFYGLMVPLYDPIAARVGNSTSPNIPLFTHLSKNFQKETYTVIYQHLYYWTSLQKYFRCLFWFFTMLLLSQVQSWIGTVQGDNVWYQWPAASNFLPNAAPLFHTWTVQGQ